MVGLRAHAVTGAGRRPGGGSSAGRSTSTFHAWRKPLIANPMSRTWTGTIKAVSGTGRDLKVTVRFDRAGEKRLVARFARLEREW